ncbi:MAG: hypothetical protein K9H50_02745 [Aurantimicrobium sp.]|nr:hypothetical protein [Aurantimicrobium sp.]
MRKRPVFASAALAAAGILLTVLTGCASETSRSASAPTESAVALGAQVVTCPTRAQSNDDFIVRKLSVINETDFAIKLQISDSDWSCDDYSGTDNPSALNGVVIPPNFGSTPVQIKVAAKWNSPGVKFGILGKLGSPDVPWISIGNGLLRAGGIYGYLPCPKETDIGKDCVIPLVDKTGVNHGKFLFSGYDHTGNEDEKYFNALRFYPAGS